MMQMRAAVSQKTKRVLGVQQLLEWAFGVEKAQVEPDGVYVSGGCVGMEYILMERMKLGGIRIDTSIGRSFPHEDAELVASILERLPSERGGMRMAIYIAELARAGITPDWMPEARPRAVPVGWSENQFGKRADTVVVDTIKYRHRGRVVKREVRACPITYSPSAQQIAFARRQYLDWWGALRDLRCDLQHLTFRDYELSNVMPPMQPWQKGA